MKIMTLAAAGALIALAATGCSDAKQKAADVADAATSAANSAVEAITPATAPTYTGILPAADCAGIRYSLTLDFAGGDAAATTGTYTLDETYLDADPADPNAYKDGQTFKSEGDFTVEAATAATAGKKYLKLVEKTADPTATPSTVYFLIDAPDAITLVGADLQPAASDLNYTLTLKN